MSFDRADGVATLPTAVVGNAMEKEDLVKIARTPMPFGKYKGRMLIDLPEAYLLWFARKEFPRGSLGRLMELTLAIKIEGLEGLVTPLKNVPEPGRR